MKLATAFISYLVGAVLLVAFGFGAFALLLRVDERPMPAVKAETSGAAPVETLPPVPAFTQDPHRVPSWIAPTPQYPAFVPHNAQQAKKAARAGKPESRHSDWRLRDRQRSFDAPEGAFGFASDGFTRRRPNSAEPSGYQEPIQFREKTEPR